MSANAFDVRVNTVEPDELPVNEVSFAVTLPLNVAAPVSRAISNRVFTVPEAPDCIKKSFADPSSFNLKPLVAASPKFAPSDPAFVSNKSTAAESELFSEFPRSSVNLAMAPISSIRALPSTVNPSDVITPFTFNVVAVIAAGVDPPITVLLMVPPLIVSASVT